MGTAVGTTVGAMAGVAGAMAAGAALGSAVGPAGTVAGAVIGGVVGGLAGKEAAEDVNPTIEEAYWNENYKTRPYINKTESYDYYRPAYRHGIDAYSKYNGKKFDEIEPNLSSEWEQTNKSSLSWDKAKPASRDAYDRLANRKKV